MPAKNTKKQPEPDWTKVSKDYINGVLSLDKICAKYSNKKIKLSKSRLSYQMKKRGITAARAKARVEATQITENKETSQHVEDVAEGLKLITRNHVKEIGTTRELFTIMLSNLGKCLQSAMDETDPLKVPRPLFLSEKETVADYLKKLSEMQNKSIELERKCLGLDQKVSDDDTGSYEDRLKELHDSVIALPVLPSEAIDGECTEVKQ